MEPSSSGGETSFTLMDSWANLAPIKDFCIVPEDTAGGEGGPRQIVTASGQASGASIRVVRSGVGAEEMVVVEGMDEVVSVWPVQGLKGKRSVAIFSSESDSDGAFQRTRGRDLGFYVRSFNTSAAVRHRARQL